MKTRGMLEFCSRAEWRDYRPADERQPGIVEWGRYLDISATKALVARHPAASDNVEMQKKDLPILCFQHIRQRFAPKFLRRKAVKSKFFILRNLQANIAAENHRISSKMSLFDA